MFSLKDTGREIWLLIDGARSQEDIVRELAASYGEEEARIEPEVASFVASLRAAALLEG